ncbi:[Protein-PII] uridylyltransferase protein [Dioscorea alata]|uniref:[Protein-PII] uridylyltransferase protein n=1 Tax=Dioscorea alata TaxID=55571 RepID=A0ACB7TZY9_DIOAL|nr:[Protein-PII] uridylyltransferase protein [Dioscorea alata]
MPSKEHTLIELIGIDKQGLLSKVCAMLTDLKCNVVKTEVWSHNTRVVAVVHVIDVSTELAIEDLDRLYHQGTPLQCLESQ